MRTAAMPCTPAGPRPQRSVLARAHMRSVQACRPTWFSLLQRDDEAWSSGASAREIMNLNFILQAVPRPKGD